MPLIHELPRRGLLENWYVRRASTDAIMRVCGSKREGDDAYAYLRDPNKLD